MIPALEHRWRQLLLLVASLWVLLSFVVNVVAVPNLVQNIEANLWGYQKHLTSMSFGLLIAYPAARATIGPSPRPRLRVFDFEHQQTNHAHEVAGLRPLPEETETLGLPKLETTTSAGFLSALEIFRHAQVQGWSAHIQEIREPKPNQLEFVVLDESGTHGTVDFRSTPSHEASTEPIFALKLKILDKQAMVYRSLTPGGGQWRIEPRGMVRRPST